MMGTDIRVTHAAPANLLNHMNFVEFFSAFGLGALVVALVQAWFSRQAYLSKRNFEEKKEAYIGLLEAYHQAAVNPSDTASKNFAYWQMRCELVAPATARDAIQRIIATNNDKATRYNAHDELKSALRKDLGVDRPA
ncbi:MAG: hypothetical protein K8F25_11905 [Fimbriimonadaceae bacterium]|nr:hypothetical protein [Alphaproteobacteria bacterium]